MYLGQTSYIHVNHHKWKLPEYSNKINQINLKYLLLQSLSHIQHLTITHYIMHKFQNHQSNVLITTYKTSSYIMQLILRYILFSQQILSSSITQTSKDVYKPSQTINIIYRNNVIFISMKRSLPNYISYLAMRQADKLWLTSHTSTSTPRKDALHIQQISLSKKHVQKKPSCNCYYNCDQVQSN